MAQEKSFSFNFVLFCISIFSLLGLIYTFLQSGFTEPVMLLLFFLIFLLSLGAWLFKWFYFTKTNYSLSFKGFILKGLTLKGGIERGQLKSTWQNSLIFYFYWERFSRILNEGTYAGIAQLVERHLAKVNVAGSNPVSRSL